MALRRCLHRWLDEVTLSLLMFLLAPYYKKCPGAAGLVNVLLAFITMPFNDGFWMRGAWLVVIGGAIIVTSK